MRQDYHVLVCAVIGYLLLSIVFTYPLILHMGSYVSGVNDVWLSMWNIWWTKKALFELHTNPYQTDYLYYPVGTSLAFHPLMLVNTVQAIFLMDFLSLSIVQAYNLLVFLSFVLAGCGAFLLAKHLTGSKIGAFIAGIIYSFCIPHYLTVNDGHFNLLTLQWIPFYVLYMLKAWNGRSMRDFLLAALFFFLTAGSSIQYAGFLVMFTVFYALYMLWSKMSSLAASVKAFAMLMALCFVAGLPFTYPLLTNMSSAGNAESNLGTPLIYSPEFEGFLLPSVVHPLYGSLLERSFMTRQDPSDNRLLSSLGITSLLLVIWYLAGDAKFDARKIITHVAAAIALISLAKIIFKEYFMPVTGSILFLLIAHRAFKLVARAVGGFWFACFAAFTLLSLGPFLHFMGYATVPLPYILFHFIPGFSVFRAPYRFLVPAYLAFSVLVAFGIKRLEDRGRKNLSYVIVAFIIFEYIAAPIFMSEIRVPSFASEIALDAGDFTVLPVPIPPRKFNFENKSFESQLSLFLLYQTVHGKKMIGGSIAHPDAEALEFIENNPLTRCLKEPELITKNECDIPPEKLRQTLNQLGVKYILASKHYLGDRFLYDEGSADSVIPWLESRLPPASRLYEDDEILVLTV
ncbi:MAG: hypothetical protein ABH834_08215 [Candidatus Altiarchaeota archaeon]